MYIYFSVCTFCLQADIVCNYHIGEVATSLQKATLIPGGSESLVYTTVSGGIGMLVPFTSHEVRKAFYVFCKFTTRILRRWLLVMIRSEVKCGNYVVNMSSLDILNYLFAKAYLP